MTTKKSEEIPKWYSFRAKNLYLYAKKSFEYFQYPIATNFAQESIEFAGKAILKLNFLDFDEHCHDFSKTFTQLTKIYPQNAKQISDGVYMSDRWLKKSREISRYGISGISPEKRKEGKRTIAKEVIKDADNILKFLITLERKNKKDITIGILNGKIFGSCADQYPLNIQVRNQIDRRNLRRRLSANFRNTHFKITIKEIPISKIDSLMDLVINPFGEIFPVNNSDIEILNLIRNFISIGGTFINLGGLPFWASHNVQTGAGKAYIIPEFNAINGQIVQSLPFKNTLSWQMFNITTTGDTSFCTGPYLSNFYQESIDITRFGNLHRNIQIHEYRGLLPITQNSIPIIRMNRQDFSEIYPIGLKQIDFGYLFLVSLQIQDDDELKLTIDSIKGFLKWIFPKG